MQTANSRVEREEFASPSLPELRLAQWLPRAYFSIECLQAESTSRCDILNSENISTCLFLLHVLVGVQFHWIFLFFFNSLYLWLKTVVGL